MVAIWCTCLAIVLAAGAEMLHARRCRRVAYLAFGPDERPASWARFAPLLRVVSIAALCWGLVTLIYAPPMVHKGEEAPPEEYKRLVLLLDVSPSMRLEDAGPAGDQRRSLRVKDLVESIFQRTPIRQFRVSVVATYSDAEPVVVETTDGEVIRNILDDLPLYSAFKMGETDLFAGLKKVAEIAKPFPPKSTTLMVLSDGDTVPSTGMPAMPASIAHVLVIGVGDPLAGQFIDGHQSRQDASTLKQIAIRLRGAYHNGNKKHVSTDMATTVMQVADTAPWQELTMREYAMVAIAAGATVLAVLPLLLYVWGTSWRPGAMPETPSVAGPRHVAGRAYQQRANRYSGGATTDKIPAHAGGPR